MGIEFQIEEMAIRARKISGLAKIIDSVVLSDAIIDDEIFSAGFSLFADIVEQYTNDMIELTDIAFDASRKQKKADEANAIIKKQFCKSADEMLTAYNTAKNIKTPAQTDTNDN